MDIHEVIKKIRTNLKISQSNMFEDMSKSTYSKIERGAVELKYDTLIQICNRLGISLTELLQYGFQDEPLLVRNELNKCFDNIDDISLKKNFLANYYPEEGTLVEAMTTRQLAYYCAITTVFHEYWQEVPCYTATTIKKIVNILEIKSFYTQFDYQILMNIIMFTTYEQTKKLLNQMYPISDWDKRIAILKNQGIRAVLNRISTLIYKQEYDEALEIIQFAEDNIDFTEDYFLALSFEYHKNIVDRFILRNTLYIERARQVITMMRRISSKEVADTYEFELNNLADNPAHYLDETVSRYPRIAIE